MFLDNVCSAASRQKIFSESIRQPVLLNRKVDLKNWHLMVYNWNKFPEIGPRRETSFCVCVQRAGEPAPRRGAASRFNRRPGFFPSN